MHAAMKALHFLRFASDATILALIAGGVLALSALAVWGDASSAALGYPSRPEEWALVTTSGFEYVRPSGEATDRRSVFSPNSVIETRLL